jgi:hypothetical protein|tara:strand:- start:997 stop:1218 length:222 start_codon:yes stop_codon:yes gene_type:complete
MLEESKNTGFYVSDEWRTNPKSLVPGGWDMETTYHNGEVRCYSNVKYPESYATTVLKNPDVKSIKVLKPSSKC